MISIAVAKKYLKMHAACCKVAHVSGAVDYLHDLDQQEEELDILENDGSSSEVLLNALRQAFYAQGA